MELSIRLSARRQANSVSIKFGVRAGRRDGDSVDVRGVSRAGSSGLVDRGNGVNASVLFVSVGIKKFKESDDDEIVKKTTMREVKMLKQLRQDNIVHLHECFKK